MELPLPSLFCDREKQWGTEVGDETRALLGSGFRLVMGAGVLARGVRWQWQQAKRGGVRA